MAEAKTIRKITLRGILDSGIKYTIPVYQRSFSWRAREFDRLVDDINGARSRGDSHYLLGSLVVQDKGSSLYVIDGQQRLTVLQMLLYIICRLSRDEENGRDLLFIDFSHRQSSSGFFGHLDKNRSEIPGYHSSGSYDEYNILLDLYSHGCQYLEQSIDCISGFRSYLMDSVLMIQVGILDSIKVQHQFEILNTAGKQLSRTDVLKAQMMNTIRSTRDRGIFSSIWDICSDLDNPLGESMSEKLIKDEAVDASYEHVYGSGMLSSGEREGRVRLERVIAESRARIYRRAYAEHERRASLRSILSFSAFLRIALSISEGRDEVIRTLDHERFTGSSAVGFSLLMLRLRLLFEKLIVKKNPADPLHPWIFSHEDEDNGFFHIADADTLKRIGACCPEGRGKRCPC